VAGLSKSKIYEALEPHLNGARVILPNVPEIEQQLLGLVWRSGKIDHQNGEHDDHANAVAGLVNALLGTREVEVFLWTPGYPARAVGMSRAELADRETARTATEHHAFLLAEEERRQRKEEQEHAEGAKDFAYRVRRSGGAWFPHD
jgi:hypothetical protein